MFTNWYHTLKSLSFSILLHIVLGCLLVFSFKFQTKPITITKPTTNIVKATSVNKEQVELELKRLREIEENKKSKEIKRQKELEKKANEAKKKAEATYSEALDQDASVFDYDGVYDQMQQKRAESAQARKKKESVRAPKYINNILKMEWASLFPNTTPNAVGIPTRKTFFKSICSKKKIEKYEFL